MPSLANRKHERWNFASKKHHSPNQQRERWNFTGDEWTNRAAQAAVELKSLWNFNRRKVCFWFLFWSVHIILYQGNSNHYFQNSARCKNYLRGLAKGRKVRLKAALLWSSTILILRLGIGLRAAGAGGSSPPPVSEIFGQNAENSGKEETNIND